MLALVPCWGSEPPRKEVQLPYENLHDGNKALKLEGRWKREFVED